jgi:hypothetical protein
MKHLATLLLATLCAVSGYGQTIKTLGYNTNGQVVYSGPNPLTFTNPISLLSTNRSFVSSLLFSDNTGIEFDGEGFATNFPAIYFADSSVAATTRTNLGLGATWLTNTNDADFRNAIGLGGNPTNTGDSPVVGSAYVYAAWGLWDTAEGGSIAWRVEDGDIFINSLLISTNAPTNSTNAVRWLKILQGTNSYRIPLYQ